MPVKEQFTPAISSCLIEPIWDQFVELLPDREDTHPLGCHNPCIPERAVFDKLGQVLVFGCAYERIADESCSATTLRCRRDEWIASGVMDQLQKIVLDAYDWMIGLDLSDMAVDCCITKASRGGQKAGRSPVDRGKQDIKHSTVVDANGIPLGDVAAPANRHDSPLSEGTLGTMEVLGALPERISAHLDRGYDSKTTRERLAKRGLFAGISEKGRPDPMGTTKRWVVERTNSWSNAYKKLVWCTKRRAPVIDFWLAFSGVITTVRRLVREGWIHYRWEGRPRRKP